MASIRLYNAMRREPANRTDPLPRPHGTGLILGIALGLSFWALIYLLVTL